MKRILAGLVVAAVMVPGVVSEFWPSHGNITYDDGGHYEGELLGGDPHGQGVATFPDGWRFEGEWREDAFIQGVKTLPGGERRSVP